MSQLSLPSTGFAHYLKQRSLPCQRADVRGSGHTGATLAKVQHAPTRGIEYPAVDDLIVSVVWRSADVPVVRDVGRGLQRFADEAGKVLVTPPGCRSFWQFDSEPTVLHLSVSPQHVAHWLRLEHDQLAEQWQHLARQPLHIPLLTRSAARLWNLTAPASQTSSARDEAALGEWRRLLDLLLREPSVSERPAAAELTADRLQAVLARIQQAPDTTPSQLARLAGLSIDHFSRAFRVSTGYTPHQMITHCRIEHAKRRLQASQVSLTHLAIDLGFSSSAHFSSRFRQLTGLAPSEWRAHYRHSRPAFSPTAPDRCQCDTR